MFDAGLSFGGVWLTWHLFLWSHVYLPVRMRRLHRSNLSTSIPSTIHRMFSIISHLISLTRNACYVSNVYALIFRLTSFWIFVTPTKGIWFLPWVPINLSTLQAMSSIWACFSLFCQRKTDKTCFFHDLACYKWLSRGSDVFTYQLFWHDDFMPQIQTSKTENTQFLYNINFDDFAQEGQEKIAPDWVECKISCQNMGENKMWKQIHKDKSIRFWCF